jgi:3-oxoacyl-[acyl-carrier-protein] synthase-3
MYINHIAHYIPAGRVHNDYFKDVNGLSDSWIFERTGIRTRSKAGKDENTNTMAVEAVRQSINSLPLDIKEVDLIIGASYSPHDTVATIAHEVQREFDINNAQAIYISSACSSLVNALEIAEGYIALGKAKNVLVVASEHNTAYSDESCEKSGHLWGDGATALYVSDTAVGDKSAEILSIYTKGLGHIGKGTDAVYLTPGIEGLKMPDGRDVFIHACQYMRLALEEVLGSLGLEISDLDFIVPHQANQRIIANLGRQLKLDESIILSNIQELGNTGSASTGICLSQNMNRIKKGDLVGITVFGGGYSTGACLLQY